MVSDSPIHKSLRRVLVMPTTCCGTDVVFRQSCFCPAFAVERDVEARVKYIVGMFFLPSMLADCGTYRIVGLVRADSLTLAGPRNAGALFGKATASELPPTRRR